MSPEPCVTMLCQPRQNPEGTGTEHGEEEGQMGLQAAWQTVVRM